MNLKCVWALLIGTLWCAGCTNQADMYSQASIAVVDARRANAEVAGDVKVAKEYLARKQFDKAVEMLERAGSIAGATDRQEVTDLLAAALPLSGTNPQPQSVNASRYSPTMGPAEVVQGYLASRTWQERVPFVLNPIETGPLMAQKYLNMPVDPTSFRPGKIQYLEQGNIPIGSRLVVKVDVSESHPAHPIWQYVVKHTDDGYKIDWQASQALELADLEASILRALRLENPVLEARVLRIEPYFENVHVHVEITNHSNKWLGRWEVNLDLMDSSGAHLSHEQIVGAHLGPGQSTVEKVMVFHLSAAAISSHKFSIALVTVDMEDGQIRDATKYFTLQQDQ